MKISVIVPVYNASQYLKKCVDSILDQTYQDLEVILIDDGSTDETPFICDSLAASDKRVTVIHKANEGPGAARQAGVAIATGGYIAFVDADDYVNPSMFTKLLGYAIKEKADIVQCGHIKVSTDGNYTKKVNFDFKIVEGNYECVSLYAKERTITDFLWDKLFKATLFSNVIFAPLYYSEDVCLLVQLFGNSNKVVIVDELLYYHVLSDQGLCRKGFSLKKLDTVKAGEFIFEYYSKRFPDLAIFPKLYICSHAARNYCGLTKLNSVNKSQLKLDMLQIFHKYYDYKSFYEQRSVNNVSFNRWFFITFFKFSPKICAFIFTKVFKNLF